MKSKTHADGVIRIQGLQKAFNGQIVIDGIDLDLGEAETMAVLGRSGTGKSVLLKLIIGLLQPDAGSIRIYGQEVVHLPLDALNQIRKKIGFLFQSAALYDSMTVEENVAFPLIRHTDFSEQKWKERVQELLSRVGMEDAKKKLPSEISGGMKKRVAIARALALDPNILLLDEPTAGLDPITAGEINELIRDLQKERKVSAILVTHDLHTVKTVSDRVALLHKGNILLEGSFEDLRSSESPFVSDFVKRSFEP